MTRESINALIRHGRVLWRAERLIGEIRLKRILRQSGLVAFAGGCLRIPCRDAGSPPDAMSPAP